MSNFFRSIGGKLLLFIMCIVSGCVLIGCVIGVAAMVEMNFYMRSEQDVRGDIIEEMMISDGDDILWSVLNGDVTSFRDQGNLIMRVRDASGTVIAVSESAGSVTDWQYSLRYGTIWQKNHPVTEIFYSSDRSVLYYDDKASSESLQADPEIIYYYVDYYLKDGLPVQDTYAAAGNLIHTAFIMRYGIFIIGAIAFLLALMTFVGLMCVSGRRPDSEDLYPGPLNRVPFDVMILGVIVFGSLLIVFGDENLRYQEMVYQVIYAAAALLLFGNAVLGFCMSTAVRIKQRCLFRNTVCFLAIWLCFRIIRGLFRLNVRAAGHLKTGVSHLPLVWRTALILCGISFLELIVIAANWYETDNLIVFWLLEKLILIPTVLGIAVTLRRLQAGGAALAAGDLSYQIDTRHMHTDFKKHAENLNSIAGGMAIAVEDRLKSERMKTELITNVSHDIKTPLTSIINYGTLIGQEPCDNPKITEYAQVLVRQSDRLKRLIEDLVEASRASTGNLDVHLAPCDAAVFLLQASGEYEEKLQAANLTLITRQPDRDVRILADGRRMWRIFDNLMNNICKYAMPGTRVYLSLETDGREAVITFKNTSREPLDMSEEELMERFTRGDASRHTEGNGLGLSIARSMAELQNGSLHLSVDGDLFKAVLTFPLIGPALEQKGYYRAAG